MIIGSIVLLSIVQAAPPVHFFYTPDCGHCMDILLGDIPALQSKYAFAFREYDINDMDNFRLLEQMEQEYGTAGEDLPIVFMGDSSIYGPAETRARLEHVIKYYCGSIKPPPDTITPPDTSKPQPETLKFMPCSKIHMYYFTQTNCRECDRTDILVNNIKKHYDNVAVHTYDLASDSAKIFYEAIARYAAIPEEKRLIAPTMIIDTDHVVKEEITLMTLDSLFIVYHDGSPMLDTLDLTAAEQNIIERFSKFSIFGIMLAGVLDGVNPCAFATLVFFVSYLLFIGKRRKDIILMAIAFVGAVFITYFGIGIGAFGLLTLLARIDIIARILFFTFGIVAIVLGILSLRDWLFARKGDTGKMLLQLPLGIKQRIHKNIKRQTASGGIIAGAFIAGFLVSFLEFGCTGQVYLPTITFMVSQTGFAVRSILTLVLYNMMFILPLIVIAILMVAISKERVASFLETRIATVKFLTALLFFGLGILLLLSAW
jgi:cytochrome c biogenesis protein CcdA